MGDRLNVVLLINWPACENTSGPNFFEPSLSVLSLNNLLRFYRVKTYI